MKSQNSSKFLMLGINFLWSAFFGAICAFAMRCLLQLLGDSSPAKLNFFSYTAGVIMFVALFLWNIIESSQNRNL